MVDLHCSDLRVNTGIGRYTVGLAFALEGVGEKVRRLAVQRRELRFARRGWGGQVSVRLQNLWKPLWKRDVLHSTHLYTAHPRSDIVTVHDCFPEEHGLDYGMPERELRWFRRAFQSVERRKVQYVVPTVAVKRSLIRLHPEVSDERVHVTYEGITDNFRPLAPGERPHPAFTNGAYNVLVVTDPHPRKRVDWLYAAAAQLLEEGAAVRVFRVGGPPPPRPAWLEQQRKEDQAARLLGDALVPLGRPDEEGLASAYRSADLLVAPSLDEGFGLPPLEALRSGTPVAATDIPVFREVLGERANYFSGPDGLLKGLRECVGRGRPSAALRQANHAFVRDTYPWHRTARLTVQVYNEVRAAS